MADVNIKIDIDADTAAIDRVRARLRALCEEVDDCADTHKKFSDALTDLSGAQKKSDDADEKSKKKKSGLVKMADRLSKGLRKLAMLGFKYVAIEAAAALAVIGSAGILFKVGAFLARGYQAALSGVSYAMAGIVAAGAAALAAMRQFQAVQFAPKFSAGAINTDSPTKAASGAMKMFVDDTQMAVVGTKGLSSAFKTLNDQAAVTGKTTAVFRQLTNYTAGMGGDLEKGSQAMAKFLAQFQKDKKMTDAVKEAGKALGPDFVKILKEANKLGLNTYQKFSTAAMKGELGKTFSNYANQLDLVNSTVIGRFKQGLSTVKSMLVEMGEPLLGPITKAIPKIQIMIEALLLRIRGNVQEIGSGSLLDGILKVVDKVATVVGNLVTRDFGKAQGMFQKMINGWHAVSGFFERIQDYMRELVPASQVLGKVFMSIAKAFVGNFGSTIGMLSKSLTENSDKWISFGESIGKFISKIGNFGTSIKKAFIAIMPNVGKFGEAVGDTMEILGKSIERAAPAMNVLLRIATIILKIANKIFSVFSAIGGPLGNALLAASALAGFSATKSVITGKGMGKVGKAGKFLWKNKRNIGRGIRSGGRQALNVGKQFFAGGSSSLAAGTAAVVGSAVGGYYGGGFVSDKLFNANTKLSRAGGALAGAGTGALIGAGIGSFVPVVGPIVGAIIGGIAGAVGGWMSAGKERRKFDNIAKEILKNYGDSMDKALKKGDTAGLKKAAEEANKKMQELATGGKYSRQAYNKRKKELEELNKQANNAISNFTNFETFFGDPDKLVAQLEKSGMGIDSAKKGILNIFDIMRKGGEDVGAVWSNVMGDFNQKLLEARLAMFDLPMQTIEMQEKVNANQQRLLEGDSSEKSVIEFLKSAYEYALSQTGGDAIKATALMDRTLTKAYGPGGSLEKVAGVVKAQADKMQLFDPQKLLDQIISTGKLATQGRAIEAITQGGVKAGNAEYRLQQLIATGGADSAAKIDKLMMLNMQGALSNEDLTAALFGGGGLDMYIEKAQAEQQRQVDLRAMSEHEFKRGGGSGGMNWTPTANMQSISVGGVTVQISGFVTDQKTIDLIAKSVADTTAQRVARAGQKPKPQGTTGTAAWDR